MVLPLLMWFDVGCDDIEVSAGPGFSSMSFELASKMIMRYPRNPLDLSLCSFSVRGLIIGLLFGNCQH